MTTSIICLLLLNDVRTSTDHNLCPSARYGTNIEVVPPLLPLVFIVSSSRIGDVVALCGKHNKAKTAHNIWPSYHEEQAIHATITGMTCSFLLPLLEVSLGSSTKPLALEHHFWIGINHMHCTVEVHHVYPYAKTELSACHSSCIPCPPVSVFFLYDLVNSNCLVHRRHYWVPLHCSPVYGASSTILFHLQV